MKRSPLFLVIMLLLTSSLYSQNIDSLLVVARNTKDDSLSITKLNIAGYFSIFSDTNKARRILREAKLKAIRTKRNYNYIEITNTEGVYHDMTGNKDSARFYFDKALRLSRKAKITSLEVRATNNLGMYYWNTGKFNEALAYFLDALRLNEKVAESSVKAANSTMYNNIGLIYQEMNMHDKALHYHKLAYEARLKKNKKAELPISLNNMAICYDRIGKNDLAEATYRDGIALAKEYNHAEYYKLLENYSGILIGREQYTEALAMLLEASDRPEGILFPNRARLTINTEIANAYVNLLQPENAITYGKKALAVMEEEPDLEIIAGDLYLALSRAYYMKGDIDDGHTYSKKFAGVTKERFSSDNASQIADMEVKYETEKKEKLIARSRLELLKAEAEAAENETRLLKTEAESEKKEKLIAENRVKLLKTEAESGRRGKLIAENKAQLLETEADARKKNQMFMIAVFFIIFLAAIGYLLFRQQRLKNIQLAKEFELKSALAEIENQNRLQEQRLTISRDLHDNIGAQLTFIISSLDNLKYRLTENIPAVGNKLEGISNFTQQTIIELRDTIWAMNTKHITFEDLRARILNFMEKAQEANENIDFKFKIDPVLMDVELSSVTGMNIYRTIQEAVNNAIKHSGATAMEIIVFDEQDMVSIIMRDNGHGFDRDAIQPGNGLQNMEKRMESIGGSFLLASAPHEGTIITIHLGKQMQSA
jgi:signal transduction histidine kinase/tetratricopeptide (TPR) repeat protein